MTDPTSPSSTPPPATSPPAASSIDSTARRATWRPESGAAIGGGREAPALTESTPTQVGEAILIGPGAMPVFGTFSQQDINSVAAYIVDLQERDTTAPEDFGGAGPVAEGLAAWLLALLPIIAFTRWIGTPHEGRDEPVEESS